MADLIKQPVHISKQFDAELNALKEKILMMGGGVERMIHNSIEALVERDSELARSMIEDVELEINRYEVEIDDLSIRILALRQPAAGDLRFITTALKISTNLERIGDLCVNVCERVVELNEEPALKPYIDLPKMAEASQRMVKDSLDSFVTRDAALAKRVCESDDYVDELMVQIFRELLTYMLEDAHNITRAMRLTFVAKYLERMGDHATNVAEMVIFMVKGKDIRHTGKMKDS